MDKRERLFQFKPGEALPLGVRGVSDGVQFAVSVPTGRDCYFNLYKKGQRRPACRIRLSGKYRRGNVCFVKVIDCPGTSEEDPVADILTRDYQYMYEMEGKEFVDPYAASVHGRERWGKRSMSSVGVRGGICLGEFDWQGDEPLRMPFSEVIMYQLHVRGFTKHSSSKVEHRGTFDGIRQKIPYLQELGVNALLLLPCYEFDEVRREEQEVVGQPRSGLPVQAGQSDKKGARTDLPAQRGPVKLNYWGYGGQETYYFAPKASYASVPRCAADEFREMVRALHQAGIEVLLDIHFVPGTDLCLMQDCLRHWVLEYHVDGFHVNIDVMPPFALISDPVLAGVKLLADHWDRDMLAREEITKESRFLADYNDGFMNCARRYLKSDEGQVESFVNQFCRGGGDVASIRFMTNVNGFTMMDLVSYDVKHNEENGESNQDGIRHNYSWNCGVEGRSRKQAIVSRRMCQIRNAFAMMLLSQGTPMLLAGDEFGNTQNGNNNPYCQDNSVTWLDWRQQESQGEILDYVKKLIGFRREHPVLHQAREFLMMDSLSCGIPDLSIHGTQAWRADYSYDSRMFAVLLSGAYQKREDGTDDDSMYIIFNMYWEPRSFDLPDLPGNGEWYPVIETYGNTFSEIPQPTIEPEDRTRPLMECQRKTIVPARSIVVFAGR